MVRHVAASTLYVRIFKGLQSIRIGRCSRTVRRGFWTVSSFFLVFLEMERAARFPQPPLVLLPCLAQPCHALPSRA
jgi:hypothetical protein